MLYRFLKILSRLGMMIWVRRLQVSHPVLLKEKGPLLLACNHPNSFLDSVILNTLFREPVWSLARGDAFKKPFYAGLLGSLKMLPVYRTSEGVENLSGNYKTFEDCITIFSKKGIVTIFSEGKCVNEWHLRPLKKGTARLAIKAWEEGIPLKVLPVGINYSSFRRAGKNLFIHFGEMITRDDIDPDAPDGLKHQAFNNKLQQQLENLVFEIPKKDRQRQRYLLEVKASFITKTLLALPAVAGYLIHLPLYWPIKYFTWKRTRNNDHFDSVMIALLLVTYPLYLLLIVLVLWFITYSAWVLVLVIFFPLAAWAYIRLKKQLDHSV